MDLDKLSKQPLYYGTEGGRPNVECAGCGGQWWNITVTLAPDLNAPEDREDFDVTGRGSEAICAGCGIAVQFG